MNAQFSESAEPRPDPVAALLQLSHRVRHAASAAELEFIVVNETYALLPYRQAVLWQSSLGVATLSGVLSPEANAPFVHWVDRVGTQLDKHDFKQPTLIDSALLSEDVASEWDEWLPASAVWLPLRNNSVDRSGILLAREEPWLPRDLMLLTEWMDIWEYTWRIHHQPKAHAGFLRWWRKPQTENSLTDTIRKLYQNIATPSQWPKLRKSFVAWLIRQPREIVTQPLKRYGTLAILCACIPVRLSVLVPGELVPVQPAAIRSPLEGTVDRFFVVPNQSVRKGDRLFQLDLSALSSKLNVSRQELATAAAEYRQVAQQAVFDPRSKVQLAQLQGHIEERQTEVEYLQLQVARAQVTSPRDGIVLMDDPTEWIGKPVVVGEKVLTIADAKDVEVEAWLSPSELIDLPSAASVTLYLDGSPLQPVHARVRYVAHESVPRPDGTYAYRVRATLAATSISSQVGLKGTARVSGAHVPLIYWVMRRPLATVRPWFGV